MDKEILNDIGNEKKDESISTVNEPTGIGTIAAIVFVVLFVIAMGIVVSVSEDNEMKKKSNKTSIAKEKGNEKHSKYTAKNEIKKASDVSSRGFSSKRSDEVGLVIYGDFESKMSDITVTKSGDSKSLKEREFKGNNAGVVVTDKAKVICSNLKIITEGYGSPGIYIDDTDKMQSVVNGNIETEGEQSPAVYTTGKMSIESTNFLSKCSESMIIEGMADVNLSISEVENRVAVFSSKRLKGTSIYMLGKGEKKDSKTSFVAKTSTINSCGGNIFDVENTMAIIKLEDCKFDSENKSIFLEAQRNANVLLTAANQDIRGFIKSDGSSKLDIQLLKGSTLKGAINTDDSECRAKLSLDKNSKLILTGDCYLTEFSNELENNVNIETNGYKIYVNRKAIKLKGKKK